MMREQDEQVAEARARLVLPRRSGIEATDQGGQVYRPPHLRGNTTTGPNRIPSYPPRHVASEDWRRSMSSSKSESAAGRAGRQLNGQALGEGGKALLGEEGKDEIAECDVMRRRPKGQYLGPGSRQAGRRLEAWHWRRQR